MPALRPPLKYEVAVGGNHFAIRKYQHYHKTAEQSGHVSATKSVLDANNSVRQSLQAFADGYTDFTNHVRLSHQVHPLWIGCLPVFVIFYGESPTSPILWPHFKITAPVNGQSTFVEDADDPNAAGFVMDAFRQIEITTSTMVRKEFGSILNPGEWAIWIPQKF